MASTRLPPLQGACTQLPHPPHFAPAPRRQLARQPRQWWHTAARAGRGRARMRTGVAGWLVGASRDAGGAASRVHPVVCVDFCPAAALAFCHAGWRLWWAPDTNSVLRLQQRCLAHVVLAARHLRLPAANTTLAEPLARRRLRRAPGQRHTHLQGSTGRAVRAPVWRQPETDAENKVPPIASAASRLPPHRPAPSRPTCPAAPAIASTAPGSQAAHASLLAAAAGQQHHSAKLSCGTPAGSGGRPSCRGGPANCRS